MIQPKKRVFKIILGALIYFSGIYPAYRVTRDQFKNLDGPTCVPGALGSWFSIAIVKIFNPQ